jgi:hypothetical protein
VRDVQDIEDIMINMEFNEEEKELLSLLDVETETSIPPCCNIVPFCCTVNIPKDFDINLKPGQQAIDFVTCLTCCIDTSSPVATLPIVIPKGINCPTIQTNVTVNLLPVKIVGAIQFIAFANAVRGDCELLGPTEGEAVYPRECFRGSAISCIGSVCVNQVVSYVVDNGKISNKCSVIPCDRVKVCFDPVDVVSCEGNGIISGINKSIRFKGKFVLPSECISTTPCPTPTPTLTPTPTPTPTPCPSKSHHLKKWIKRM